MELAMTNGFTALSFNEMEMVDGGGLVGKILGTIGGVATIVGGVCLLATPEPTTLTKSWWSRCYCCRCLLDWKLLAIIKRSNK